MTDKAKSTAAHPLADTLKRAETTKRLGPLHYRRFFENAVEGAFISTPDGRYLSVNPALARMYGYASPRELMAAVVDIQAEIYVDPKVREEFKRRVENDGQVEALEYQVRRRDGSAIWIREFSRAVKDKKGRALYYEGTIQNITRRKVAELAKEKLEVQLRQSVKMQAIGTLAGGIAHDFNNVLGAIIGFTELALDDLPAGHPVRVHLREVVTAGHRAKDLVKRILTFSRQTQAERVPVRLGPLINEVVQLMLATLPAQIECRVRLQTQNDWVFADPSQMHQVIMNLCANAGYAMREHGGLLVVSLQEYAVRPIPATPSSPSAQSLPGLRLSVTDSGHGMSPEVQERIFEPFFTTKPTGEGTGMGLSVVHGIVANHAGAIQVESQLGQGSTFHVDLPQWHRPQDKEASTPAVTPRGRGRILLVDDEEMLVRLAQQQLRKLGYRVTTRLDSQEAWRTFKKNPHAFDLVITDQDMPGLSGTQLLAAFKRLRPEIPVILWSGVALSLDIEKLLSDGFAVVLPKPVSPEALGLAVFTHILSPDPTAGKLP